MSRIPSSIINFEGFQRDRKEWLRFARGILGIFGITFFLLVATLEFIMARTAETMDFRKAAEMQAADPRLIWNSRDSKEARFKLIRLAEIKPEVVVMGHSRMAQFRSAMFHPYSFYNFSRLAWNWDVYVDLLRRLIQVSKPKVIFFSLDFTSFDPAYTQVRANAGPDFSGSAWKDHLDALYDIYMTLYTHPQVIFAGRQDWLYHDPTIGMRAALYSYGFRGDGSETDSREATRQFGNSPSLGIPMQWDHEPFFYGDKMGSWEVSQFETFAAIARDHGIQLVGVQMPYYGPVLRAIENNPNYGILRDFRAHLADGYFQRQEVIVFDYSKFPPYEDDYHYFLDQVHTGEPVSAAVLRAMWTSDDRIRKLLPNLDVKALDARIQEDKQHQRHAMIYGDQF